MDKSEAMAELKFFVLDHGLPKTEMALFGIKCPYCGKSDRIRQLEPPQELQGALPEVDLQQYTLLWQGLAEKDGLLGICKFCLNPLKLHLEEGLAEPLLD
jgi:hypothetical protein